MPDSGSSAGMASVHTETMWVTRRSVKDRDERAAVMLMTEERRRLLVTATDMTVVIKRHPLSKVKSIVNDGIDVSPGASHDEYLGLSRT